MEGVARGSTEEVRSRVEVSPASAKTDELENRLAGAGPLPLHLGKGLNLFEQLAGRRVSFDSTGRAILWTLLIFPSMESEMEVAAGLRTMVLGKATQNTAMRRGLAQRSRALLPLPLPKIATLAGWARAVGIEEFCLPHFAGFTMEDIWVALSVLAINATAGYGRVGHDERPSTAQASALRAIREGVKRVLPEDLDLPRSSADAEKELASRYLTYTGEEVPKMQVLRLSQAQPALPPESHGGSIDATSLVSADTKWFLEHPEESLLSEIPQKAKLQAKVHVKDDEALELFSLLVKRKICDWIPDSEVLQVNGQQVLSGMFAVGKGTLLEDGSEVQLS